jgi:hypothetical protein
VRAHRGALAVFGTTLGRPCAALPRTSRGSPPVSARRFEALRGDIGAGHVFARLSALPVTDFDGASGCGEEEGKEEEESRCVLSAFAASSATLCKMPRRM